MLVEIRTILIKRETELENLENSQPIHIGMEKNRREDKFDKEISKDQPSKQMPGATVQNNGRMTLKVSLRSLGLPFPSQAQSARACGDKFGL